ncbi:alpha/beta hydrolase [Dyadobacter pollutisoli]|jgi:enterochelin esterase-like enzyme|uniref:Alpha/beta hydrolase-fold protein n=1 Tax=Dyadobacter pollutisoli TaxID=2910158 RepID=A0A9E8NH73_9BACT|nr:alpha/beta hydrolase-fold protein [Dyadobacter pollutisoli]WAC15238.1 alpha/beta hydrolase-fold protein [Dyadobacter pollutisoli]
MKKLILLTAFLVAIHIPRLVSAQTALQGSVERIKVHGKGLEGNLEGNSADPEVSIYLPPSYKKDSKRRYPVVYLLHGFTDNDAQWYGLVKHWINLPVIVDKVFAGGQAQEMIIVTPNAYTRSGGSFYSNSITVGNWEEYVANELVSYIDQHYRTIAKAASRGLAGHSMGGYGTMRIGERYPKVFSSLYLLSPCCMVPGGSRSPESLAKIEAIKDPADFNKADFGTKAALASAAAWSPNPTKPPFYTDQIVENGEYQKMTETKWAANSGLATIDQYISNLKQLKGIAFDAGDRDQPIASNIKILHQILDNYKIEHSYEEYQGDHLNKIGERIEQKMLPFFSKNLSGQ